MYRERFPCPLYLVISARFLWPRCPFPAGSSGPGITPLRRGLRRNWQPDRLPRRARQGGSRGPASPGAPIRLGHGGVAGGSQPGQATRHGGLRPGLVSPGPMGRVDQRPARRPPGGSGHYVLRSSHVSGGDPRLVRDWPTFLTAGVPGHVRPDPAPEAAGPGIFFLERNLPASRVQPEQLQGGCMPDMLLARRADDEEVTHDPGPGGQPADKNEPGQSGIGADQVAASVRIKEVGRQPTGRVEP